MTAFQSLLVLNCIYLLVINVVTFLVFGADKRRARREETRVPETTLFTLAACFGGIGAWAGMYVFRHKTKHKSFVIGIPAILFAELILVVLWFVLV